MIQIRAMRPDDLPAVRPLMVELGYDLEAAEVERSFRAVAAASGQALLVGEWQGRVVALLHVYARPALDKPPEAVVQALVVSADGRRSGIGKAMMEAAEAWARANGYGSVALASQIQRADAHAFYKALGYDIVATSHLLRKELTDVG